MQAKPIYQSYPDGRIKRPTMRNRRTMRKEKTLHLRPERLLGRGVVFFSSIPCRDFSTVALAKPASCAVASVGPRVVVSGCPLFASRWNKGSKKREVVGEVAKIAKGTS